MFPTSDLFCKKIHNIFTEHYKRATTERRNKYSRECIINWNRGDNLDTFFTDEATTAQPATTTQPATTIQPTTTSNYSWCTCHAKSTSQICFHQFWWSLAIVEGDLSSRRIEQVHHCLSIRGFTYKENSWLLERSLSSSSTSASQPDWTRYKLSINFNLPASTRRRIDVLTTLFGRQQRRC